MLLNELLDGLYESPRHWLHSIRGKHFRLLCCRMNRRAPIQTLLILGSERPLLSCFACITPFLLCINFVQRRRDTAYSLIFRPVPMLPAIPPLAPGSTT